jgi:chemotaxis protein methyltransferase CheR
MAASSPSSAPAGASPDYGRFCAGVKTLCGIELGHYRPAQMERRLRSFAERAGHSDLDAYLARLRRDVTARDAFLDRMTINVSELFRNPERFAELERDHLPALAARSRAGALKVWSAGCSYGAEPYSLAILLREMAPRAPHEVLATDIDRTVLARAREGRFSDQDLRSVTPARRARWFEETAEGPRAVAGLRGAIRFSHLDLLSDAYPGGCDLILCRNVVIYFNEDAKERLYAGFFRALRPGGILFVGSTERINRPEAMGWEKAGTFFYRRP